MSGKVNNPEHEKFTKALASVLSVSPEERQEMREKLAQAKAEKPSPHTRYTYDPEADRS